MLSIVVADEVVDLQEPIHRFGESHFEFLLWSIINPMATATKDGGMIISLRVVKVASGRVNK